MAKHPRNQRRQNTTTAIGLYFALSACGGTSAPTQELEPPSFMAELPKGPIPDHEPTREEPLLSNDEGNGITTNYYFSHEFGGYVDTFANFVDGQTGVAESVYIGQMFCADGQFEFFSPFDLSELQFTNFDQAEFDRLSTQTCSDNDQLSEADLQLWLDPNSPIFY